ncbi:MAG: hypothetical protein ACHQWU_02135 [Gemmatimonadales bacterium]
MAQDDRIAAMNLSRGWQYVSITMTPALAGRVNVLGGPFPPARRAAGYPVFLSVADADQLVDEADRLAGS